DPGRERVVVHVERVGPAAAGELGDDLLDVLRTRDRGVVDVDVAGLGEAVEVLLDQRCLVVPALELHAAVTGTTSRGGVVRAGGQQGGAGQSETGQLEDVAAGELHGCASNAWAMRSRYRRVGRPLGWCWAVPSTRT